MKITGDMKVFYEDTKELKNLLRSLRLYNKVAYKQVVFRDRLEELEFEKLKDGTYKAELKTDSLFKKVYGSCEVYMELGKKSIKITRIEPYDLLMAGYRKILDTYKGIPYRDNKDLFKIRMMDGLQNGNY